MNGGDLNRLVNGMILQVLGGDSKEFFLLKPQLGEDVPVLTNIFSNGLSDNTIR